MSEWILVHWKYADDNWPKLEVWKRSWDTETIDTAICIHLLLLLQSTYASEETRLLHEKPTKCPMFLHVWNQFVQTSQGSTLADIIGHEWKYVSAVYALNFKLVITFRISSVQISSNVQEKKGLLTLYPNTIPLLVLEFRFHGKKAFFGSLRTTFTSSRILHIFQVIPGHGNPQKRWTMFGGYLFKYCCVKYQTFHQVCEKASQ